MVEYQDVGCVWDGGEEEGGYFGVVVGFDGGVGGEEGGFGSGRGLGGEDLEGVTV